MNDNYFISKKKVHVDIKITQKQGWLLADFFKGISFHDILKLTENTGDAYETLKAIKRIDIAIQSHGFIIR